MKKILCVVSICLMALCGLMACATKSTDNDMCADGKGKLQRNVDGSISCIGPNGQLISNPYQASLEGTNAASPVAGVTGGGAAQVVGSGAPLVSSSASR